MQLNEMTLGRCPLDRNTGLLNDPRYVLASPSKKFNLQTLEKENGIEDIKKFPINTPNIFDPLL